MYGIFFSYNIFFKPVNKIFERGLIERIMQQSFKKKEIESNWQHLRNIAKFQNWSTAIKLNRSHLEWWKNLNRYINNINTFTQKLWCLHGCNMVFRLSTIEFNSFLVCSWRNRLISKFFAIQYVVNQDCPDFEN